ncbi:MAG: DUF489 family protein, partial [Gammaproteobacteria bacterium]
RQHDHAQADALRYAITLLYLETKLNKRPALLERIGEHLDRLGTPERDMLQAPETLQALAEAYTDTIGTLPQRVRVVGDPQFLKPRESANRVRALLLGGIRAARLWRQVGGRRWHLLFRRRRLLDSCDALLRR